MKVPRFRIGSVMLAVAFLAVDFGAIRARDDSTDNRSDYLLVGALPMANILVVGVVVAQHRPKGRPFFLGFGTFGAAALALYVALTILLIEPYGMRNDYEDMISSYLDPVLDRIEAVIGRDQEFVVTPVYYCVAAVMLGWPQLAFAVFGGFVSRRYKGTVTQR